MLFRSATPRPAAKESIDADALPALIARATDTSDDLTNCACKDVTFIFARGSTESGNMVCAPFPLFPLPFPLPTQLIPPNKRKIAYFYEKQGFIVGPQVCTALKTLLGPAKVACQGVGSPYNATLPENFMPKSTSPEAIGAATTLFNLAHTKCPNTKVVTGGYSQGSAVVDNSIQELEDRKSVV